MRVNYQSAYIPVLTVVRDVGTGDEKVYNDQTYVDPASAYSARSDITINPKDSDGWRRPSAYSVTVTDKCYASIDTVVEERYFAWGDWVTKHWTVYGNLFSNGPTPIYSVTSQDMDMLLPPTSVEGECLIKALNNVADRKGSLLESIAEMRSTVKGLGDNAKMVDRFLVAAVRKDWRGAAKALGLVPNSRKARRARDRTVAAGGGASDAWLNYWFGLSPIIDDMVFALVALNTDAEFRMKGVGVSSMMEQDDILQLNGALAYVGSPVSGSARVRDSAGAVCSLWYSMRSSQLAGFTRLGLYDVPSTVWAVVPYSFAIDWVVPVSSLLKSWTASVGLTFRGGSFTRFSRRTISGAHLQLQDSATHKVIGSRSVDVLPISGFRMERSVYTSEPTPTSLFLKDPLSVWTTVTALSLLGVRLQSLFK